LVVFVKFGAQISFFVDAQDPTTADPGILVEDGFQCCGLGKAIFLALCREAVNNGLTTFNALIHYANQKVVGLLKSCGLDFTRKYNDGLKEVCIWL
jgi:hypothetical protein